MPRHVAFVGLAAIACLVLSACSPGADYPSLFPAVHDIPPPRSDTPLDRNQVQQATEDLISARDRLSAEAQGGAGKNAAPAKPAAKSSGDATGKSAARSETKSGAKSAAKSSADPPIAAAAVKKPASNQVKVQQTPGPNADQTAGSEIK